MTVRILALSGSLRATSTNTALLRAAVAAAPEGVTVDIYEGLGTLPIFSPDLDGAAIEAVSAFRARLLAADGLLIASPEYAHGVPGGLKNALDWAVGWEEYPGKPVALWHTSPYGEHAKAALAEILKTMSSCIIPAASISVMMRGKKPAEMEPILSSPETRQAMQKALEIFTRAIPECARSNAA